jgi:hypothetical protein
VPIIVLCDAPAVAVIVAAVPAVLVSWKFAGVPTPGADAVTLYGPATLFAVKMPADAVPVESVTAVAVVNPLTNIPLAPLAGAVNVTVTFGTGFPSPSFTSACNAVAKLVNTTVVCGVVPVEGAIDPGAPGVFVSAKLAAPVTPVTVAVTL